MLYYVQVDAATIAQQLFLLLLLPLVVGLFVKWRYPEIAAGWQPQMARAASYSLLLLVVAGLVPGLPHIASAIGTGLIPAAFGLAVGGTLIGYGLTYGKDSRARKVMAMGSGQRNLAAAFLVAAGSFSADTFVMTLVAAVTLTIIMHVIGAEWGRRNRAGTVVEKESEGV